MALDKVMDEIGEALEVVVPGCAFGGPANFDEHSRPPRVVWQPLTAKHTAPRRIGGGAGNDGALWTREVVLLVQVWGEDLASAETLLEGFVNACHRLLTQHSYQLIGEQWTVGARTSKGAVCDLTMTLMLPIPRTKTATTLLEAVAITKKINGNTVP